MSRKNFILLIVVLAAVYFVSSGLLVKLISNLQDRDTIFVIVKLGLKGVLYIALSVVAIKRLSRLRLPKGLFLVIWPSFFFNTLLFYTLVGAGTRSGAAWRYYSALGLGTLLIAIAFLLFLAIKRESKDKSVEKQGVEERERIAG